MKAAILTEYGNNPQIVEVDRPDLPDDSVMVEVHAAAINPIDWIVMAGYVKDMLPYELPWIVGYDMSGVVVEVGPGHPTRRPYGAPGTGHAAEGGITFHSLYMEPNGEQLDEIPRLISDGTIRPVLDRTFPLNDVAAAYDHARTGGPNGKVAVAVR